MPLNDIACKGFKPESKSYKKSDEKGLYLEIMPNGSKYWHLKYRFNKKENRLSFGVYPEISLKEAREKRDEARKLIREGIDPAKKKKVEKLTQYINAENSFENVAREWHNNQKSGCTERHANYVLKRLRYNLLNYSIYTFGHS